ncbi:unnamed protein product [Arctogadus glacialis]
MGSGLGAEVKSLPCVQAEKHDNWGPARDKGVDQKQRTDTGTKEVNLDIVGETDEGMRGGAGDPSRRPGKEQETPGDPRPTAREEQETQATAREGAGDPSRRPGKEQETPGDGPGAGC